MKERKKRRGGRKGEREREREDYIKNGMIEMRKKESELLAKGKKNR